MEARRGTLGIAVLAALACALPVAPAAAATPAAIIASLNAQRSASWLPAGITQRPSWSRACNLHDRYEHLNGDVLTHVEQRGRPGYTSEGAFAARNSVLANVPTAWDLFDPFESAPLHLDQLLGPGLSVVGADDSIYSEGGETLHLSCVTTFPGYLRRAPRSPRIYTYPGNGARIYPAEVAFELPITPGQAAGLPPSARTGPYIYVFAFGRGVRSARILRASVTGPAGRVAIKTVDDGNRRIGAYLNPGGIVIPTAPLVAGDRYSASVTLRVGRATYRHDWSFRADSSVVRAEGATGPGRTVRR